MNRDVLIDQIHREDDPDRAKTLIELLKALDEDTKSRRAFWSNPLMLALAGGIVSVLGGIAASVFEHRNEINLAREKAVHELVRDAVASSPDASIANLSFLAEAGLLDGYRDAIISAAVTYGPTNEEKGDGREQPVALFLGAFGTLEAAKALIDRHLSDHAPDILSKENFYSVFVEVENVQAGRRIIETLPKEIQDASPFMRSLELTCSKLTLMSMPDVAPQRVFRCDPPVPA